MSMDVDYLKNCIGRCLVEGLAEVADRRPVDPVNFLAYWIYRYKEKLNEEEKRKKEMAQLEREQEEALVELEKLEKMKAEERLIAQKFAEQQKTFSEQYPTNTIAELTGKYGAPNLPTVEESDENSVIKETKEKEKYEDLSMKTKEKDVNIPEENDSIVSKQEALEDAQDQSDLNVMKNKLNAMPGEVSTIITFQEAPGETILYADLNQFLKEMIDDKEENEANHYKITENEYDTQSEDDTPDEEYKSSHPDLNSKK